MSWTATRKRVAWLAGAALIGALWATASIWAYLHIEQSAEDRQHTYLVLHNASKLLSDLKDAETGQRGYLLTGETAFLDPYLAVARTVNGSLLGLKNLCRIPAAQRHLEAMTPLVNAKMADIAEVVALYRRQDQAAIARVVNGNGKRLMDAIRARMQSFVEIEEAALAARVSGFEADMRILFIIVVAANLLTPLLALAFVVLLHRNSRLRIQTLELRQSQAMLGVQEHANRQLAQVNVRLQASEAQLAVTLHSIGDAVVATDAEGRVTLLNPRAVALTGWTPAAAIGRPVEEILRIVDEHTGRTAPLPVHDTLALGTVLGLAPHTVLIALDGTERAIDDTCAPIRDHDDRVVGAVLVFRDVTEQSREDDARKKDDADLRAILDATPFPVALVDANDVRISFWSHSALQLFGQTAPTTAEWLKLAYPDADYRREMTIRWNAALAEARRSSQAVNAGIYGVTCRDGSVRTCEMYAAFVRDRLIVTFNDISDRMRTEEALQQSGTLQRAIFDSANFSSIATDARGVIQIFNVGAERMLGYTAAEVINIITPADISDPQEVIVRATALSVELDTPIAPGFDALVFKASRGIEDIYELTYIRKDGSRFPAVVSVTALRDAQNTIIGYLLIGTDNTARKEAEAALLQAGALQRAIFDSANFSSIATDAKGVIQIFNVGAERMLGYTAAEVMNIRTPADISDPQEVIARATALSTELGTPIAPGFDALVFKASRGIEDIYELTYIRKDGSRFPAVVSVTALRDAQNTIIGYLLIGTDNTARKEAEEALLQAGALQRAIFDSANFSSIATDARGVIQIFNVGAERMLGYTAAEVMNIRTPADISDPQEVIARATALSVELDTPIAPGFDALVFKASRGIEDIYELTYIRKDGSRFPAVVSVTALRDAQNTIIGYLLIGTDNTARKLVEEERSKLDQRLRDQHFYTRSIIESSIDALIVADPRGIITDINRQTEALTGCTRDELVGAPFKNYFTDPDSAQASITRVLNEGRVANYELTARDRDGRETTVSYNASTFHDRDRRLQGIVASARDVTDRKQFEQALQEKNAELQDANRLKSEFLANMSHELRTPLNAIIGFSEVLRDGLMGEMTGQQRGFIGDIFTSGQHLLSLINDILDLSKVESGTMTLDLEPVMLPELLADSLSIVREKAAAHHVGLAIEADDNQGSIQVDVRKVKQVVYNLLANAVKFSSDGDQVTLRTARVPRADVGRLTGAGAGRNFPLADSPFSEFIRISVTDTGIGIAPEGLARLFEPFSQIDSGLARRFEGTGLGLAMVKRLVELHVGTVAVESVEGVGSCFTVWLPLRAAPVVAGDAVAEAPQVDGAVVPPQARVALVVEDDVKSADLIRVQLEAEGFTVLLATSAEAALVLAQQQPLSLITLDVILPGMDGWEFLGRIRQMPSLQRLPVIVISIVADRKRGISLGAAAVLQKPISRQVFYEALVAIGLAPLVSGRTLNLDAT